MLTLDGMHKALSAFWVLGTRAVEITGGGEPTLHPEFDKMIEYAYSLGYKIGICTNGTTLTKWKRLWWMFDYVRLGMYGFDEGYEYDLSALKGYDGIAPEVSAAYVWDMNIDTSANPNITGNWSEVKGRHLSKNTQKEINFYRMLDWVEENKIPTRIAFNAIKPVSQVKHDMGVIRDQIKHWEFDRKKELKYAFLSDFNYKGERKNDKCFIAQVKPFLFTNGFVYPCPSMELSPENNYTVNDSFKLCDIDGILDYYNSKGNETRHHSCSFCKYALQNELIEEIKMDTTHNDFA